MFARFCSGDLVFTADLLRDGFLFGWCGGRREASIDGTEADDATSGERLFRGVHENGCHSEPYGQSCAGKTPFLCLTVAHRVT
jgi:hypothetical protein